MANLRRANGRDKPWKVHYVAVGNESWGCGGSMRPEFYADNFRRYNTFIKNYAAGPENEIYRVACGPNAENYEWTDTVMKIAGEQMNGLSLHYYTIPSDNWSHKGPATGFSRDEYFSTLGNTLRMEELIRRHSAIMDKYDPKKRVGLVVDEWGVWTDVEPGTNPGFLYQQNSLRDALLAAINLHIFQAHADRVSMANIAQMVNVLQAMVLTDHEKVVRTPTFHVFEMLKVHQGATSLPIELVTPDLSYAKQKIPMVSASASRDSSGRIHVSFINTNPDSPVTVACRTIGSVFGAASGRVLTAPAMDSHNTFDAPHVVEPAPFLGATVSGDHLSVVLPPMSVAVIEL
jgi:alpha-L-arabinofuranosidase